MSHVNSDFDSAGAQYGIYTIVRHQGKPCHIVCDCDKTLALASYEHINAAEGDEAVISPPRALEILDDNWLCIVVDTNRPALIESPEVWRRSHHRAVIDHHICYDPTLEGAEIFLSDTALSSCGEIVSRMLFHFETPMSDTLCNLLLAGIMLDTHRFSQKTTPQTFQTAAFLTDRGANVQAAYNMFDTDHSDYISRAKIVCRAQIRDGYALSMVLGPCANIRTVAPQAADEMLTLRNVKASFVVYKADGILHISARGDADYDVAEIMEKMGGGGNKTMAGAQISAISMNRTIRRLRKAIREYTDAHPEVIPK